MSKKLFAIFVVYLLLSSSLSIKINADPPPKNTPYPENDNPEEQEKWILENPSSFNPNNPSQRDSFVRAYNKGKIKYPEHIEAASNYISTLNNGFTNDNERKIAARFVSYLMSEKGADFKEGNIKVIVEGNYRFTYIVTSDGVRHDINQIIKIPNLKGIKSKPDGTLDHIRDDGTINTKGTSLTVNSNGELVTSNGQTFSFEDLKGKTASVNVQGNTLSVKCENGCVLSKGYTTTTLNPNGVFSDLGNNRFQVEDGNTRLGQNLLAGKYTFALNIGKDGHTTFDLTKPVELFKFQRGGDTYNSFLKLNDPFVNDGKLHYGIVDIATGIGKNGVVACFTPNACDSSKLNSFDGYVKFAEFKNSNCNYYTCEKVYKAEIKGLIATRFNNDAFHEGFDRNFVVSYYDNGKDAKGNGMGIFTLESCNGCKVGKGEIVGIQTRNNNFFQIQNKYYSDARKEPQLRNEYIPTASQFAPYLHYAKFNKEGITFFDNDVYRRDLLSPDTKDFRKRYPSSNYDLLHTGVYKSDTIVGIDNGIGRGGKSVLNYLDEFYSKTTPNAFERKNLVDQMRQQLENQKFDRNIFVVDNTAFNYDRSGRKVNVQNLYVITSKNENIIDQIAVIESGIYSNFLLKEATKKIIDILDARQLDGKVRVDEFNRLLGLKLDETLMKEKLQFVSGLVDAGRGILTEHEGISSAIRNFLKTFPSGEAERLLKEYSNKYQGAQEIFRLREEGKTLQEIVGLSGSSGKIKSAFEEPFMVHRLNQEIVYIANLRNEPKANIYYIEEGAIKSKTVDISKAGITSAIDTANAYSKDGLSYISDKRFGLDILTQQMIADLDSDKDKEILAIFLNDLRNSKIKLVTPNSMRYLGLNYQSFVKSNSIDIGDGSVLVLTPEILDIMKDGKIYPTALKQLVKHNIDYGNDLRAQQLKIIAEALVPKTPIELAINIVPEIGTLGKGAVSVYKAFKAGSVLEGTLAFGKLSGNVALVTVTGFATRQKAEAEIATREVKKIFTTRPETVAIPLSTGTRFEIDPATVAQDLRALATSRGTGAETSFGIPHLLEEEPGVARIIEGQYILPKKTDIVVGIPDAASASEVALRKSLQGISDSRKDIESVLPAIDLEQSFGVSKPISELSEQEKRDIIRNIVHYYYDYGEGGVQLVWNVDLPPETLRKAQQRVQESARNIKDRIRTVEEGRLLQNVDLYRTEFKMEDFPSSVTVEDFILDLGLRKQIGTKTSSYSLIAPMTPIQGHSHPADIFDTGSYQLNKMLDELAQDNPFDIKYWDQITSARIRKIAPSYLEFRKGISEGDVKKYSELLQEFASNPKKTLVDVRAEEAAIALRAPENGYLKYVVGKLEKDGLLWKIDPVTEQSILDQPRKRLELFLENKDLGLGYIDPKTFTQLQLELVSNLINTKNSFQQSDKLLGLLGEGASDTELFLAALDRGVVLPSRVPGDIYALLIDPKRLIKLQSGESLRVEKIIYPNGITYVVFEEESKTLHMALISGDKQEVVSVPLNDFLKSRMVVYDKDVLIEAGMLEDISKKLKGQESAIKVDPTLGYRLEQAGLGVYSTEVQDVLKLVDLQRTSPDEVVILVQLTKDMHHKDREAVILALTQGKIKVEDLEALKSVRDVDQIIQYVSEKKISIDTVRSIVQDGRISDPLSLTATLTAIAEGEIKLHDIDTLSKFSKFDFLVAGVKSEAISIDSLKAISAIDGVTQLDQYLVYQLAKYWQKTHDRNKIISTLEAISSVDIRVRGKALGFLIDGYIDENGLIRMINELRTLHPKEQEENILKIMRKYSIK